MRAALQAAAAKRPGVQMRGGCDVIDVTISGPMARIALRDGTSFAATLLIAADGRKSGVRERVGLKVVSWSYPQTAIVTLVKLEKPHQGRAVQHFLPAGPFAILPLPDDHACITWSEDAGRAAEILALDECGLPRRTRSALRASPGGFPDRGVPCVVASRDASGARHGGAPGGAH